MNVIFWISIIKKTQNNYSLEKVAGSLAIDAIADLIKSSDWSIDEFQVV